MGIFKALKNTFQRTKYAIFRSRDIRQEYETLKKDPLKPKAKIRYQDTLTEQMFNAELRIDAYAQSNNLYDNDDVGSILETNVRLAIGQTGGMPVFTGKGAKEAQNTFNTWKKSAGYAEGEHWHDMLELILRTVKLHGDCLVLMDPDLTGNKLRVWDADQIVNINDTDFRKFCDTFGGYDSDEHNDKTRWKQVEGVLMDTTGRVIGYFVTSLRNRMAVKLEDATFLPIGLARRVVATKKITQYRGEPLFLPNSDLTLDTRSLIKSEVKSGMINAEHAFFIKRPATLLGDAIGDLSDEQIVDGTTVSEDQLAKMREKAEANTDYKAFKGKSAIGFIGDNEDVIKMDNASRPALPIQQWMDKMNDANGKRLGVMSCLARGRADNSYSSGQIEVSISWASFAEDQKMLERQVVDYVCDILCPGVAYTVTWPEAFEIDPQKSEATKDARLRGGRTTFEEMLGPYWQQKLLQLAKEKKFLEENGLENLSFFQSVSGASAEIKTDDNTTNKGEQQ